MSSKPRARKAKAAVADVDAVPVNLILSGTVDVAAGAPAPVSPAPASHASAVQEAESVKKRATKTESKKSSKKTPPVVAIVTPSGITGSFMKEQRPLIAHLPVSTASLTFEAGGELHYDPNIAAPKAYEIEGAEHYSYLDGVEEGSGVNSDTMTLQATPQITPQDVESRSKLPSNYSEKLMVLFQDANRYNKLPEKTEIACFWCCHNFSGHPFAIPSHILDETWYMYGNFCSPECASAYLFKERIDSHVQWERYALLNSLYASDAELPHGSPQGIRPAPPREVLRMFGGSMDISEYRNIVHEKKIRVDVLTPPMVSIIQTMDTKPIDFYDQTLKNVFIRNDIQHKYNAPGAQGLRLRRSKPVKSRESTVEWAMQIQHVKA